MPVSGYHCRFSMFDMSRWLPRLLLSSKLVVMLLLLAAVEAACPPGFRPPDCLHQCPQGQYGLSCASLCPITCSTPTCRPDTGDCFRCRLGFEGAKCNTKCSEGRFGQDCLQTCGENCLGRVCDAFTGACPGCEQGFFGTMCDHVGPVTSDRIRKSDLGARDWRHPNGSRSLAGGAGLRSKDQTDIQNTGSRNVEHRAFFTAFALICSTLPICLVGACLYLLREKIKTAFNDTLKKKRWTTARDGFFCRTLIPRSKSRFIPKPSAGIYDAPFRYEDLGDNHGTSSQEHGSDAALPLGSHPDTVKAKSGKSNDDLARQHSLLSEVAHNAGNNHQRFLKGDESVEEVVDMDTTVPVEHQGSQRSGFAHSVTDWWRRLSPWRSRWSKRLDAVRLDQERAGSKTFMHRGPKPRPECALELADEKNSESQDLMTDSSTTTPSDSTSSEVAGQDMGCNTDGGRMAESQATTATGESDSCSQRKTCSPINWRKWWAGVQRGGNVTAVTATGTQTSSRDASSASVVWPNPRFNSSFVRAADSSDSPSETCWSSTGKSRAPTQNSEVQAVGEIAEHHEVCVENEIEIRRNEGAFSFHSPAKSIQTAPLDCCREVQVEAGLEPATNAQTSHLPNHSYCQRWIGARTRPEDRIQENHVRECIVHPTALKSAIRPNAMRNLKRKMTQAFAGYWSGGKRRRSQTAGEEISGATFFAVDGIYKPKHFIPQEMDGLPPYHRREMLLPHVECQKNLDDKLVNVQRVLDQVNVLLENYNVEKKETDILKEEPRISKEALLKSDCFPRPYALSVEEQESNVVKHFGFCPTSSEIESTKGNIYRVAAEVSGSRKGSFDNTLWNTSRKDASSLAGNMKRVTPALLQHSAGIMKSEKERNSNLFSETDRENCKTKHDSILSNGRECINIAEKIRHFEHDRLVPFSVKEKCNGKHTDRSSALVSSIENILPKSNNKDRAEDFGVTRNDVQQGPNLLPSLPVIRSLKQRTFENVCEDREHSLKKVRWKEDNSEKELTLCDTSPHKTSESKSFSKVLENAMEIRSSSPHSRGDQTLNRAPLPNKLNMMDRDGDSQSNPAAYKAEQKDSISLPASPTAAAYNVTFNSSKQKNNQRNQEEEKLETVTGPYSALASQPSSSFESKSSFRTIQASSVVKEKTHSQVRQNSLGSLPHHALKSGTGTERSVGSNTVEKYDKVGGLTTSTQLSGHKDRSHEENTRGSNSDASSALTQTFHSAAEDEGQDTVPSPHRRCCVKLQECAKSENIRVGEGNSQATQTDVQTACAGLPRKQEHLQKIEVYLEASKNAVLRLRPLEPTASENMSAVEFKELSSQPAERQKLHRRGTSTDVIEISETRVSVSTGELTPSSQRETLCDCPSLSAHAEMLVTETIKNARRCANQKISSLKVTHENPHCGRKVEHPPTPCQSNITSANRDGEIQKASGALVEKKAYPIPTLLECSLQHGHTVATPRNSVASSKAPRKDLSPTDSNVVFNSVETSASWVATLKDCEEFRSIQETSSERYFDALEPATMATFRQIQNADSPNYKHRQGKKAKSRKVDTLANSSSRLSRTKCKDAEQTRVKPISLFKFLPHSKHKSIEIFEKQHQGHDSNIALRFARPTSNIETGATNKKAQRRESEAEVTSNRAHQRRTKTAATSKKVQQRETSDRVHQHRSERGVTSNTVHQPRNENDEKAAAESGQTDNRQEDRKRGEKSSRSRSNEKHKDRGKERTKTRVEKKYTNSKETVTDNLQKPHTKWDKRTGSLLVTRDRASNENSRNGDNMKSSSQSIPKTLVSLRQDSAPQALDPHSQRQTTNRGPKSEPPSNSQCKAARVPKLESSQPSGQNKNFFQRSSDYCHSQATSLSSDQNCLRPVSASASTDQDPHLVESTTSKHCVNEIDKHDLKEAHSSLRDPRQVMRSQRPPTIVSPYGQTINPSLLRNQACWSPMVSPLSPAIMRRAGPSVLHRLAPPSCLGLQRSYGATPTSLYCVHRGPGPKFERTP